MAEAPERLIVALGPNRGVEYELGAGEFTIGRSTNNDIVLPLPEVSRRHARIWKARDGYYIEDLGSTNGTFVNDARVHEPVLLVEGAILQIGDSFRLLFTTDPAGLGSDYEAVASLETGDQVPEPAAPAVEIPTPKPPAERELGAPEVVPWVFQVVCPVVRGCPGGSSGVGFPPLG